MSAARGGGGGKRGGGRGGRGERAAGAGLAGADDPFSFTGVEIEDWEAAAGSGAAAGGGVAVSTSRAKARVREVCRSIAQAGVQHAIPAEADEVAAAIGAKFDSGARALTDVEGAQAMQNVFIEELGALRALPLGASREIEWLRHNRCLVMTPEAETLAVKRARRDGDADVSSSDEGGEEELLGRADKEALLRSFYSIGFDKFSKAEVFGRLTTAEVSEVCKEVAEGASINGDHFEGRGHGARVLPRAARHGPRHRRGGCVRRRRQLVHPLAEGVREDRQRPGDGPAPEGLGDCRGAVWRGSLRGCARLARSARARAVCGGGAWPRGHRGGRG